MNLLAIETSTPTGGVALVADGQLLGSMTITSQRGHSRLILPAMETLMKEAGIGPGDLDVVAATRGPGAFTGVRVGLSLAKGLCLSGTPRLLTVSTLEALAHRAWCGEQTDYVLPLLNARQGQVYGAFFRVGASGVGEAEGEEFALTPEDVLARWPGRCLLAGTGAQVFADAWEGAGKGQVVWARPERRLPSAESLAFLALERATQGLFEDPAAVLPVYLREATIHRTPKKQQGAF
ncbi:MAG: tRNA threonylcarbamoyladenosine biosynthesis protein TsaB [Candidatus Sumerlaeota bacterium]|nr:tRNA threonylcarbamoyladenosine biosynthesis protein TsaB [Candidatus Sumerlaeota bacterium]